MSQSATSGHTGRIRTTPNRRPKTTRTVTSRKRLSPRSGFTKFENELWDVLPSAASVGVYLYLRTLPEKATISQKELAEVFREGRDSMGRVLDELMGTGLLVRVLYKGESNQFLTKYVVRESVVTAAEVLRIAAERDTMHMVVPVDLARPLYKLGLHFQPHTPETVVVTGFTSDTRTLKSATDSLEPVFPLVEAGYGFPSEDAAESGFPDVVTGSGFPGPLQGTRSSYRSLPPTPHTTAASLPGSLATREGGIHAQQDHQHPQPQTVKGGADADEGAVGQVMRSVIRTYDRSGFSANHLDDLAARIRDRLTAGYSTKHLNTVLTSNPDGMKIPGLALRRRLDDLVERDRLVDRYAAVSELRPWCGRCHIQTRLIEGENSAHRCPDCHPNATATNLPVQPNMTAPAVPAAGDRKHRPWRELLAELQPHERAGL